MSFVRLLCSSALLVLIFGGSPLLFAQQKPLPAYTESDAGQHAGEEATVTGKVVAISKSAKGTTYLNFGDRFPRQVFSGVVLTRDEAKVGDVKMYEGKVVTLTGKIELSPDQKPQILISAPTQIQLAEPAGIPSPQSMPPAAPTAPVPGVSVAPVRPTPVAPKPAEVKKMVLAANWSSPVQGGEMTRKDLATLFGGQGSASESAEGDPSIVLFGEVNFLAPLAVAKKRLQLEGASAFVSKVTCPGLPIGSLTATMFSGVFAGGYNRLYLVTDNAEQVVSILLVDENPRQRSPEVTDTMGYHTYNFINGRSKGNNELVIKHQVATEGAPRGVVVVESTLVDPTDGNPPSKGPASNRTTTAARTPKTGKLMERSRWYVPGPVVNLILRCVGNR
jgi:hypothetical protein